MKRIIELGEILWILFVLTGCSVVLKTEGEWTGVEYKQMDVRDVPEDLQKEIEERKEEPFQITYRDMEYLYIAEGYGEKEESGYCIEIAECAQTEDAVYIEAILHGPGGEGSVCETKFPFYVVRLGYTEKPVVFDE